MLMVLTFCFAQNLRLRVTQISDVSLFVLGSEAEGQVTQFYMFSIAKRHRKWIKIN